MPAAIPSLAGRACTRPLVCRPACVSGLPSGTGTDGHTADVNRKPTCARMHLGFGLLVPFDFPAGCNMKEENGGEARSTFPGNSITNLGSWIFIQCGKGTHTQIGPKAKERIAIYSGRVGSGEWGRLREERCALPTHKRETDTSRAIPPSSSTHLPDLYALARPTRASSSRRWRERNRSSGVRRADARPVQNRSAVYISFRGALDRSFP